MAIELEISGILLARVTEFVKVVNNDNSITSNNITKIRFTGDNIIISNDKYPDNILSYKMMNCMK